MKRLFSLILLIIYLAPAVSPLSASRYMPDCNDSIEIEPDTIMVIPDYSTIHNELPGIIRYVENNSEIPQQIDRTRSQKIDFTLRVSPSYSREASLGIGFAVNGLFRLDRNDKLPQPSSFFAGISASIKGFYIFRLTGNLYFPNGKSRINYKLDLYRKSLHFWGTTLDQTSVLPQSQYDRRAFSLNVEYQHLLINKWFVGAVVRSDYTTATHLSNPSYLEDEKRHIFVNGLGPSLMLDTRDNTIYPTKGVLITANALIYPYNLSNYNRTFFSYKIGFNCYTSLWRDATGCLDLYGKLNSRTTPWSMREYVAADDMRMRGYYYGSSVDRSQLALQYEIRQHIWDRLGMAAWGGVSTLFASLDHSSSQWRGQVWLPNWGIGLRLKLRPNLNSRIDLGFGKNTMGVLFAIGEAF